MKKIVNIVLLLITNIFFAQSVDSLFAAANQLYQQEKYEEALSLYHQINDTKVASDDLYYNMANAYYNTNKVAPSIYYYEKALLLNPTFSDAAHNLSFARRMGIDNIEPLPKSLGQKFSESIVYKLNYNTWAYVAVICSFLFALLFLLYHFSYRPSLKRFYFISSILSVALVFITVLFAYSNFKHFKNYKAAIVFAEQSSVKGAPSPTGEINFELHEGTKVQVLEQLDDYKKISIADGKIGWILAADIKELN